MTEKKEKSDMFLLSQNTGHSVNQAVFPSRT